MELEFQVQNQDLIRKDDIRIINKLRNYLTCKFFFETDNWNNLEKYVIFKDGCGRAYQFKLGKLNNCECTVPSDVLTGNLFKVTVYGGDLLTTNDVTILLSESGYTNELCKINPNVRDVFTDGFNLINTKLSNVTYQDNVLNFYANKSLINSINILDESMIDKIVNSDELIDKILSDGVVGEIQNSLEHKADEIHTHISDDIIDFEDKSHIEIRQAYLSLANKIRTHGE